MKYIFSFTLFAECILALVFSLGLTRSRYLKGIENKLLLLFASSSFLWSCGFSLVFIQTNPEIAYVCRCVGMIGTFMYLISGLMLICYLGKPTRFLNCVVLFFTATGIVICALVLNPSQTHFYIGDFGMTYTFKKGVVNTLYTLYTVLISLTTLGLSIRFLQSAKTKHQKSFAKQFLIALLVLIAGSVFDTILPMLGLGAVPGSSIAQFFTMMVIYDAVSHNNRSRINVSNVAEFVYHSLSVPVLVYDSNRKLQIMNSVAGSFLGKSQEEIGLNTTSAGKLFDLSEEEIFSFDNQVASFDTVCLCNDADCSLSVNKIYDTYQDVIGYLILITDLSDRMQVLRQLEEAKEEAERANKTKSLFLANTSHEIRTPMNSILGLSELALKMNLPETVLDYLTDIKHSAKNLLAIINDILDISRLESGKVTLINENYYTATLIQDVHIIIDNQAKKKGLEFVMNLDPAIPHCMCGDKIHIRGILINLLNNAVKYTKEGTVTLDINILKTVDDITTLEIKVKDTGIGIKEEELEKIFDSFSQADYQINRAIEGTGLGLSIVKGYVSLMNGSLSVESTYGEGSVFTVLLDQKVIDSRPIQNLAIKEEDADGFKIGEMKIKDVRALIVDDNRINLKVAGSSLEYYGIEVDTASSGEESIELCKKNKYDFIFMDQMMPGMDGVEAMHRIRELDSHYAAGSTTCKIIILTANALTGMREQLINEGFDEYLGKPINFTQLERIFNKYISLDKLVASTEESSDDNEAELANLLPDINIEDGITFCGGTLEYYLEILHLMYELGEKQINELYALLKEENRTKYLAKLDAIRDQLLNIGAENVANLANDLENGLDKADERQMSINMEIFAEEYKNLLCQILTVLRQYNKIQ